LVSLYESLHSETTAKQSINSSTRSHTPSSMTSSKVRLQVQTIFSGHNPFHRSSQRSSSNMSTSSKSSSIRSASPSSSFLNYTGARGRSRVRHPSNTLDSAILSDITPLTSYPYPTTPSTSYLRRQPSAIDIALQEERYADEAEIIGLGLLEPRPRANTGASIVSSMPIQCSMLDFLGETAASPVVLDSIFDVMERA
jgi:hypothetical protein